MSFRLFYERKFIHDLKSFSEEDRKRIKNKLGWLAENAFLAKHIPLKGVHFEGVFKLRIGNKRAFYKIDFNNRIIYLLSVKFRKDAYR